MAVSSSCFSRVFPQFECRSEPEFSATLKPDIPSSKAGNNRRNFSGVVGGGFSSSLILRFPPNFVRQLSTKARRNCSNIGVAQVVAASWSNNTTNNDVPCGGVPAATAVDAAAIAAVELPLVVDPDEDVVVGGDCKTVDFSSYDFLSSDGSRAIHAGERLGRGIVTDAITTPVVNTSAYFFKKTADLLDFKEGRQTSFEYGRYGNPNLRQTDNIEMGQSSYEPYYLHQNHHQTHQQPPEYHYHHTINEPRNPNFIYTHDPIPTTTTIPIPIPIHIPKQQRHINTLFVSGLPDDVMPREIYNLFRRRPGFDSCQLKFTGRGNQVVAFVTFFNHQSAVLALQALDGVKFDPQAGSVLHIELARSNSRRTRKPGSGPYVVIDKRKKSADDAEDTSSDDGDNNVSDNQSQSDDPDFSNNNIQSAVKSEEKVKLGGTAVATNERKEKASEGDLKPCSTLFIANLGPNCSEDELKQALSQYSGFNGLKLRARGGMPVAFADYEEVEQATHAMQALQDSTLPSSDRGGMHIEYARSKMRKP